MKAIITILIFLFSAAVLIGMSTFALSSGRSLADLYTNLDAEWASAIIVVSAIFILCTLILGRAIYSLSSAKDKNILPEKSIVYQNFIGLSTQLGLHEGDDDGRKYNLEDQHRQMMLWASDAVLKEYLKFQKLNDDEAKKRIDQFERVILAMRRDLGYSNALILRGDLHTLIEKARRKERHEVEA